ncbi:mucin-2 [Drosophila elegans]|uniref:mucin-2 n=1 Tax=Drosophila elegans TaxID=30023 RepID=UPI0007E789A9|nr:mucin-2 [Drosophila elegans]
MLSKSLGSPLLGCLIIISAICGIAQSNIVQSPCPMGYQYVNDKCFSFCSEGQYLHIDGKCYPQTTYRCRPGYFLNTDGKCYRTNPEPCPFESTTTTTTEPTTTTTEPTTTTTTTEPTTTTTEPTATTTTTTTTEPTTTTTTTTTEPTTITTTTTTEPPIVDPPILGELTRCPPGSIYFDSQCRKIVCTEGEYYAGRCIFSACPPGTVWFGKRCQEPGYITTILEIGNEIHNEHRYTVTSENINRVEYITAAPYDPDKDNTYDFSTPISVPDNSVYPTTTKTSTTTRRPWIYTSIRPTTEQSVVIEPFPGRTPKPGCCFVKSPRICVNYAPNWVCSTKEKKFCDPRVCTAPVVYLKPPQIVHGENPKRVIMPPNPPLLACSTPECMESEVLDCSGCKDNRREKCSQGCYSYYCPNGSCAFMNTENFCAIYPGEFGCNAKDGCIWDWCNKKCY